MTLRHALNEALDAHGVTPAQFSELMIRLLDHGVLCRDESKKEAELYDRYLRIPELVEDYLSVLQVRLHHERRFSSLRLYPPGAEIPGQTDPDEGLNGGLRHRLGQQEVALVLVLRAEYDKALREGQVDEHGQVTLPLEALNLASKNLLGRPLPEGRTEREALFRRMRQLRLIRGAGEAGLDDGEAWLTLRPDITGLVTDAVLATLIGQEDDQPCT
ncbi:DUF4194 domain-containing protein [Alcanivorax marinus]|uniref:DUF4194 domain-containing protein n=1 Tax=Alloalcanivorax marinus TaxID=1177169 RepID=A0A9Q3ULD9_9GAMM|nr:DUF4194 domain-containing protein [Alloalcanivorax marinus]MCC4309366.1 DUF4194 domain-containing protein [Alloalcanivorax marinus]MCU5787231.1 hypothetical protein [Alloalcanivorax marinus]